MSNTKDFVVRNGIRPTVYHEAVGTVVSGSEAYSLTGASYDGVSFSVATQVPNPLNSTFSSDGTKFYVIDSTSSVFQYSLSTAWDLSTASYSSKSFVYTSQIPSGYCYGVGLSTDGTKMYLVDLVNDVIYQYTLSTAFDISTASYDSVSLSVNANATNPYGLFFKPDGTELYIADLNLDSIVQYTLSTAWSLSSATYTGSFSTASQDTTVRDVYITSNGTKMFVLGNDNSSIYAYTLSTAWDVTSASYDGISFSTIAQEADIRGLFFSSTGDKMFVLGYDPDTIYQYSTVQTTASLDLSTGSVFDYTPTSDVQVTLSNPAASGTVSGATLLLDGVANPVYDTDAITYENKSFSLATQDTATNGVWFKPDGTKMYSVGFTNDRVYQYSLSTPWDISTAAYDSVFYSVASQDSIPKDVQFKPDGLTMFVYGAASETVYQYTLSTAWDVSTASYASKSFAFAQGSSRNGAWIGDSGTKMYMAETGTDSLFQYTLSTAWDVSTASYALKTKSVAAQDTNPHKVALNSDGTKAFVLGQQNGRIYQYSLTTSWDISTASFVSSYTASQSSAPLDFFSDEAGRLYILYETNDTLYQYSMESIYTITYDPTIQWAGGTAPTSPAIGETDVLTFTTRDGGTTYNAALAIDGAQ